MPYLGAHLSAAGGPVRAARRAAELGAESMQIFTQSPRQWSSRPLTDAAIDEYRRAVLEGPLVRVVSHAPYLINLAGDDHTREVSVRTLEAEIARCDALGIDAIVLHPGSGRGLPRAQAIERLVFGLKRALKRTEGAAPRVLLETMAGRGDEIGSTIEELADVLESMDWNDRLGVCVDMCHVFGAGMDVRTSAGYERLVERLRSQVGLERVGCWHLSDNKEGLGSHLDRHAHLGDGCIGLVPFGMLAADERFADTPAILETPKDGPGEEGDLAVLWKLRGKEQIQR